MTLADWMTLATSPIPWDKHHSFHYSKCHNSPMTVILMGNLSLPASLLRVSSYWPVSPRLAAGILSLVFLGPVSVSRLPSSIIFPSLDHWALGSGAPGYCRGKSIFIWNNYNLEKRFYIKVGFACSLFSLISI